MQIGLRAERRAVDWQHRREQRRRIAGPRGPHFKLIGQADRLLKTAIVRRTHHHRIDVDGTADIGAAHRHRSREPSRARRPERVGQDVKRRRRIGVAQIAVDVAPEAAQRIDFIGARWAPAAIDRCRFREHADAQLPLRTQRILPVCTRSSRSAGSACATVTTLPRLAVGRPSVSRAARIARAIWVLIGRPSYARRGSGLSSASSCVGAFTVSSHALAASMARWCSAGCAKRSNSSRSRSSASIAARCASASRRNVAARVMSCSSRGSRTIPAPLVACRMYAGIASSAAAATASAPRAAERALR